MVSNCVSETRPQDIRGGDATAVEIPMIAISLNNFRYGKGDA